MILSRPSVNSLSARHMNRVAVKIMPKDTGLLAPDDATNVTWTSLQRAPRGWQRPQLRSEASALSFSVWALVSLPSSFYMSASV